MSLVPILFLGLSALSLAAGDDYGQSVSTRTRALDAVGVAEATDSYDDEGIPTIVTCAAVSSAPRRSFIFAPGPAGGAPINRARSTQYLRLYKLHLAFLI